MSFPNDSSEQNRSSPAGPQTEGPGAYPIPFCTKDVEWGSRLDSIPVAVRYWAVDGARSNASWHAAFVEANERYEEWLNTQPPGEYPVPFAKGKRLDKIRDQHREWGIHPDRSSSPWYNFYLRANARYVRHLAEQLGQDIALVGRFPLPAGINKKYTGMPIENVPQDTIWWGLRPPNRHRFWYQPLYDANKRLLDDKYKSRSPGSEPIWFGKRHRGLRLDDAYARTTFRRWYLDPQREGSGWYHRLRDLVDRLEAWRLAHPERRRPHQRRKAANIQNPVGEAIGPWDDSPGSAGEDDDEYDKDSFVQSDSEEPEYSTSSDDEHMEGDGDNQSSEDSTSSSEDMEPTAMRSPKRKRVNVVMSDEEDPEDNLPVTKLGKRYRVQCEDSEDEAL